MRNSWRIDKWRKRDGRHHCKDNQNVEQKGKNDKRQQKRETQVKWNQWEGVPPYFSVPVLRNMTDFLLPFRLVVISVFCIYFDESWSLLTQGMIINYRLLMSGSRTNEDEPVAWSSPPHSPPHRAKPKHQELRVKRSRPSWLIKKESCVRVNTPVNVDLAEIIGGQLMPESMTGYDRKVRQSGHWG